MQRAWVISIGTELTLGQTPDTNAGWLAGQVAELGIRTERCVTVPDDAPATRQVLLQAAETCDLILVTGGLGPTIDDVTRQALAEAAGVPLELDPASLERLRAFFAALGRDLPEGNKVQALIPRGGVALPNACGTAPGVRIDLHGTPCYALPGVPFEMRSMFEREVAPQLRGVSQGAILLTRRLHTFGLPESIVGQRIADLMQPGRNPEVGTAAQSGLISVRITATGATRPDAQARMEEAEAEVRRRLGEAVFGRDDDTLAGAVGTLLVASGQTLSTAESCTGGLIGSLLTDVPGASRYYRGGVVAYANDAKVELLGISPDELAEHGAVSRPVARALATGAARAFGTGYGLSTTGVAGPTGGSPDKPVGLVFIGLHTPEETTAHECRFGSDLPRAAIRLRAAHAALNLLRLRLLRPGA
jgi:nicotinamide-nucleotide amidase